MVPEKAQIQMQVSDFIKSSGIFENVSPDVISSLLKRFEYKRVPSGAMLFQQGDQSRALYIIMDGAAKTYRENDNGDEVVLRLLNKGDVLVENILSPNSRSPIYAKTVSESSVIVFLDKDLKKQMKNSLELTECIMSIVADCYKEAVQQIECISLKTPLERVGHFFLSYFIKYGSIFPEIDLPHSKTSIANHLAMAPETFSRTLKQIRDDGITFDGKKLKMQDTELLCKFCDSDITTECKNYNKKTCCSTYSDSKKPH
jgi:CRP/FNR family transcriptional regulator